MESVTVKKKGIITSKFQTMVRSEILSHVEFGYLGVSFTGSEGRMEQEVDRSVGHRASDLDSVEGKAGAQPKGEALDLLVNLRSSPQL